MSVQFRVRWNPYLAVVRQTQFCRKLSNALRRGLKFPVVPIMLFVMSMGQPLLSYAALESLGRTDCESIALNLLNSRPDPVRIFGSGCQLAPKGFAFHSSSARLFGLKELGTQSIALSFAAGSRQWALGLRSFGWEEWREQSVLLAQSQRIHSHLSWRGGLGLHRLSSADVFRQGVLSVHFGLDQDFSAGAMSLLYRHFSGESALAEQMQLGIWQELARSYTVALQLRTGPGQPMLHTLSVEWHPPKLRISIAWLGERGWRHIFELPFRKLRFGAQYWLHPLLPPSLAFSFSCFF